MARWEQLRVPAPFLSRSSANRWEVIHILINKLLPIKDLYKIRVDFQSRPVHLPNCSFGNMIFDRSESRRRERRESIPPKLSGYTPVLRRRGKGRDELAFPAPGGGTVLRGAPHAARQMSPVPPGRIAPLRDSDWGIRRRAARKFSGISGDLPRAESRSSFSGAGMPSGRSRSRTDSRYCEPVRTIRVRRSGTKPRPPEGSGIAAVNRKRDSLFAD